MHPRALIIIVLVVVSSPANCLSAAVSQDSLEVLSRSYTIDRKYKSMEGPSAKQQFTLTHDDPPQLVWITGYRVEVVGEDGAAPVSQEFMCHNNLDLVNVASHNEIFMSSNPITPRLFTLSQGQFAIRFPEGFGLPLMSTEPLALVTQVLNHNIEQPNLQVRHKMTIDFIRDRDLTAPFKPLFSVAPFVMVLLEGADGHFGMNAAEASSSHGSSCLPGAHAPNGTVTGVYADQFGRKLSGHWVVKPGHHEYATPVTKVMNLAYDTTLHYVAVHVHPYAQTLELRDVTADATVFSSHITNFPDRVGVQNVEVYSSSEGLPLYHDHEYDLISVYDNPTGVDQDAMATFFLYLLDRDFEKPGVQKTEAPVPSVR